LNCLYLPTTNVYIWKAPYILLLNPYFMYSLNDKPQLRKPEVRRDGPKPSD
jgi:hypothetical protein